MCALLVPRARVRVRACRALAPVSPAWPLRVPDTTGCAYFCTGVSFFGILTLVSARAPPCALPPFVPCLHLRALRVAALR